MAQPAAAVPANLDAPAAPQTLPMKQVCAEFRMLRNEGRWPNVIDNTRPRRLLLPKRGPLPRIKKVRHWFTAIPFTEGVNSLGVGHRANMFEARHARRRVRQDVQPHHLQPVTTLGWGGNGIATLYRYQHAGVQDYFVVKAAIHNTPRAHQNLANEAAKQRVC